MNERRHYSKAFKLEAVRLLALGEQSAAQLARELGIRRNQRDIKSPVKDGGTIAVKFGKSIC